MARPKGSKSKTHSGYKRRTEEVKERFGKDIYRQWGKLGGNPILLKSTKEDKS